MNHRRGGVIINVLAALMFLELAGAAAVGGYLMMTGKLTKDQARLAYGVLKGEVTDATLSDAESWKKRQAAEAAKTQDQPAGPDAATVLAASSQETEMARLGLEKEFKGLQDRQRLAEVKMTELEQRRKLLDEDKKKFDERLAKVGNGTEQEGFRKMLTIMKSMKSAELKAILVQMDEATAVEVLRSMGERPAAKVLAEYKTPAEVELKLRLLEKIKAGPVPAGQMVRGK